MESDNNAPEIKIKDPVEAVRQKYDTLLTFVIAVLFVGFLTLLLTVFGLVIDAWNTKTAYYQNYEQQQSFLAQFKIAQSALHAPIPLK